MSSARDKLTRRQREVLQFIEQYFDEHGYVPPYREVTQATSISSLNTVSFHFKRLVRAGYLRKDSVPGSRNRFVLVKRSEQPVPKTESEAVALVVNALVESKRIASNVDVLPYLDSILIQWPNGPAFVIDVTETNVRGNVVGYRGKVPVVEYSEPRVLSA